MSETSSHKGSATAARLLVPFGGAYGWLAELTVSRKVSGAKTALVVESYYVAEADKGRALGAIRAHAGATKDAQLTPIRVLSRKEIVRLGLKPGQVKRA